MGIFEFSNFRIFEFSNFRIFGERKFDAVVCMTLPRGDFFLSYCTNQQQPKQKPKQKTKDKQINIHSENPNQSVGLWDCSAAFS